MNVPCFVITLNPQSERTLKLLANLRDAGINAEIFNGVDGRQGMPALQGEEILARNETLWRHQCEMTASEVGCYLSHYRLIRAAYQQGCARICIFEDDVELEPGFARIYQELVTLPDEFEMIRLMALKVRKRKVVRTFSDGVHQLVRPERGMLGTQGYLISRRGMEKFLSHACRIFEAIDKVYDHFYEYDLRVFGVEPHIILEMAQPSSVVKSNRARASVPLWVKLFHPIGKGLRSQQRHRYLREHKDEFYPAEKPGQRPGRSVRLR